MNLHRVLIPNYMSNEFATARDFDHKKTGNHIQVNAWLNGYSVKVDIKLKDILERLNRDNIITITSCQYDLLGYTNISFGYIDFYNLLEKIRLKHILKYGDLSNYKEDSLWCAIAMNNCEKYCWKEICQFTTLVGEYEGYENESFDKCIRIQMRIYPTDVAEFVKLWDLLFE